MGGDGILPGLFGRAAEMPGHLGQILNRR